MELSVNLFSRVFDGPQSQAQASQKSTLLQHFHTNKSNSKNVHSTQKTNGFDLWDQKMDHGV